MREQPWQTNRQYLTTIIWIFVKFARCVIRDYRAVNRNKQSTIRIVSILFPYPQYCSLDS